MFKILVQISPVFPDVSVILAQLLTFLCHTRLIAFTFFRLSSGSEPQAQYDRL